MATQPKKILSEFLIRSITSLLSFLPLKAIYGLGRFIGRLSYRFKNRNKHIANINLALCFPGHSHTEHNNLLKKTLIENAKTLLEAFWLWRCPEVLSLIGLIENESLLKRAQKQGTIFVTPHFGSWELIGLLTASQSDLLILYAPPKSSYIEKLSCRGRSATGGVTISTENLNIKTLIKHIKNGGSVGILPDQVPSGNGGIYSSFFNRKAYTSTLVCRLANKLKCPVVFCFALRTNQGKFNAYYYDAVKDIFNDDTTLAVDALNKTIENYILKAPEQYVWGYKKFKNPAPGDSYPY